jgi:YhcH/YjgK/YiaL family protein
MVVDKIKNAGLYYSMGEKYEKAFKFLQDSDISKMAPGKYEIDGSHVYALVQQYDSKPLIEGKWEAHRKYTDIQYVAEGAEQIGYANIHEVDAASEYDSEGDYLLLQGHGSMIPLNAGSFAIFWPEDAHMPCIALNESKSVRKVVVKVEL